MKSKTKIKKQVKKKRNPYLVETILLANKHKLWIKAAQILSNSTKKRIQLNLEQINKKSKENENVVVPGKVLSEGEINKKIKIIALSFSEKTKEKLNKTKTPFSSLTEEIKKNPEAKGIRILG